MRAKITLLVLCHPLPAARSTPKMTAPGGLRVLTLPWQRISWQRKKASCTLLTRCKRVYHFW